MSEDAMKSLRPDASKVRRAVRLAVAADAIVVVALAIGAARMIRVGQSRRFCVGDPDIQLSSTGACLLFCANNWYITKTL